MATQGFDNPSKFRDEWDKQAEGNNQYGSTKGQPILGGPQ